MYIEKRKTQIVEMWVEMLASVTNGYKRVEANVYTAGLWVPLTLPFTLSDVECGPTPNYLFRKSEFVEFFI